MTETLTATHVLEYTYTRSTGPIIGAFVNGLKDKKIVGVRAADGRVLVPPQEYDPQTSDELTEIVEGADTGVVATWAWNAQPREGQPLDHPFAWAVVKLDVAAT